MSMRRKCKVVEVGGGRWKMVEVASVQPPPSSTILHPLSQRSREPPIHAHALPRDVARVRRGEEGDDPSNLLRCGGGAPGRRPAGHPGRLLAAPPDHPPYVRAPRGTPMHA